MKKLFSRFKIIFYLLLFISLISCASTPLPQANSVRISEDFFGVAHALRRTITAEEVEILDVLGMRWVLNTFYWSSIEPERGVFNFSRTDSFVNAAVREGKKVIAVLAYDTPWLYPDGKTGRNVTPENLPHFLRFVEEVVMHYKDTVDVWEIWNEPNNFFWRGTRNDFYELTRQTAQRIREIHPEAYILGGAFWRTPKGFIRGMHRAGAMQDLDGIAFHPYDITPEGAMNEYDRFLDVLSEINFTGAVWITEMGYPTEGWPIIRIKMELFPSYVIKTVTGIAARGPRVLIWYELFDGYNEGEIPSNITLTKKTEQTYGLIYPNFQKKNGGEAFELCARYLPGSRYAPEFPRRENIPSHIVSFCFMEGTTGNNTLILWNDRNSTERIRLSLLASITVHDISTGNASTIPNETVLEITKEPVFITWQGADIPVLSRAR